MKKFSEWVSESYQMEPGGNTPLAQAVGPDNNYGTAQENDLEGVRQSLVTKIEKLFAELDRTPMAKGKAANVILPIIMHFVERYKLSQPLIQSLLHRVKLQMQPPAAPVPQQAPQPATLQNQTPGGPPGIQPQNPMFQA